MMTCKDLLVELSDYLDDHIDAAARQDLERHLAHCATCKVLVDSTRKTIRIVTESRSFELPAGVPARILEQLRASSERS
jgi:anti-sigma factor RsiW